MRFTSVGSLLVYAVALIAPAAGQNPPAPPATVRTSVAATKLPLLGDAPAIESAHPSPMSADRGFFGSRPFSRANGLLAKQGAAPVDWTLA